MEKTNVYDKYVNMAETMVKQSEIIKFLSTHVKKDRKGFKVTTQLINEAKEYFKGYSDEAFAFLQVGEYIEIGRGQNREVISLAQFEYDKGLHTTKRYYFTDGKTSGGYLYRHDAKDRRGIHQLAYDTYPDGEIIKVHGHSRYSKGYEEHANISMQDGKVDEKESTCIAGYTKTTEMLMDVIKEKLTGKEVQKTF